MEQYASAQWYREHADAPERYDVQHITEPRRSCIGLPRQYGPATPPADDEPHGWQSSERWQNIAYMYTSYGFNYVYKGETYNKRGWASEYEAAVAHDAFVLAHGHQRPLLLPDIDRDDLEATA